MVNYIPGHPKSLALNEVPRKHVPQQIGTSPSSPVLHVCCNLMKGVIKALACPQVWTYPHWKGPQLQHKQGANLQAERGAILGQSDFDVRWVG